MQLIHVVAVGGFGLAVAESLRNVLSPIHVTQSPDGYVNSATWPETDALVLAAWRPEPKTAALLDTVAFQRGVPFIPAIMEHPYLRVGPTVVPGFGSCYHCFLQRLLQHAPAPHLTQALYDHYASHPTEGPAGYPPFAVSVAAMTLAEILHNLATHPASQAGVVRQINVQTMKTTRSHVVGVHGCPRCGLRRTERTRSYETLAQDVARLIAFK